MSELESSVLGVLERHGPQPKHALVTRLNEGRVAQLDHGEIRDALTGLERERKVVWTAGVVRLAGSGTVDISGIVPDDEEDWSTRDGQPGEWEKITDDPDGFIEGPDVPQDDDDQPRARPFYVATEWREVTDTSPERVADQVLGNSEHDSVLVVEEYAAERFERALVTRRVP